VARDLSQQSLSEDVAEELADLADLLGVLAPEEWEVPSLCGRWRVRQVVGHLLADYDPKLTVGRALVGSAVHRGVDRYLDATARAHEVMQTPESLVARLRALDRGAGVGAFVPVRRRLHEHVVHHQDIRRPLGRPRVIPEARLRVALDVARAPKGGDRIVKWAKGLTFTATDLDWTVGTGPVIAGRGEALLLALSRRPVSLGELAGDGVAELRSRLGAPA
jgi:uncharacterized protein (TIGR03083 family)